MQFSHSLVLLNALFFFSLIVIPSGVNMRPCPLDDCPCIRRGSWDSAYLQSNYPALYTQYSTNYTFSYPVITYPDCEAIIANCTAPAQIAALYSNGTIKIGGVFLPNPYKLTNIYCEDGGWKKAGLGSSLDENVRATNVSCALKI